MINLILTYWFLFYFIYKQLSLAFLLVPHKLYKWNFLCFVDWQLAKFWTVCCSQLEAKYLSSSPGINFFEFLSLSKIKFYNVIWSCFFMEISFVTASLRVEFAILFQFLNLPDWSIIKIKFQIWKKVPA